MTSLLHTTQNHGFSSLVLNRPRPTMPSDPVLRSIQPREVIEISDDDDEDDDNNNDNKNLGASLPNLIIPYTSMPTLAQGTDATVLPQSNVRPHPDTSPIARRDSKRQKLDDAPETSSGRVQYPRIRMDLVDSKDGFAQFYPAFFDDAFVTNDRDDVSEASTETAVRFLRRAAVKQARRPPYYFDSKLNIRMYCGAGHKQFPLPVDSDPKLQEACEYYDVHKNDDTDDVMHEGIPVSVLQQECLARVLDIFPDIQHDFVLERVRSQRELIQFPDEEIEMHPDSAAIIHEILEMTDYPRQKASKEDKKHEFEERLGKTIEWSKEHRRDTNYKKDAVVLLAGQFDHVPTHYINSIVLDKGNLFDAYMAIEATESDYFQGARPYNRSKRPRVQLEKKYQVSSLEHDTAQYCNMIVELQAAKQNVLLKQLQSNQRQQLADAEKANIEQHRIDGLLIQCKCCFDDEIPINRTVVCRAEGEHRFCYGCIKSLAESQIGLKKYEMQCMDESGCNACLDLDGIGKAVPIKTFDRLQFNQQQAEIKAANIDGLVHCPFCDFQAICDPIELDTLFSCQNPDCFKVSCRKCLETSHLPKSCEEVKKDRGLSARHKVEEARTNAMIRTCPSCQSAIVKSDGCNKMRCTCKAIICYACKCDLSKLRDPYSHFDKTGGKCPLYDDKKVDRHVQEADEAEERAIQDATAADDTIEEDTLRIETGKSKWTSKWKGKGKASDLQTQDRLPGFEENLRQLRQQANQLRGRRARQYRGVEFLPFGRHTAWLEGVQQNMPAPPVPQNAIYEPIQPMQQTQSNAQQVMSPPQHVAYNAPTYQHPIATPLPGLGQIFQPERQSFAATTPSNLGFGNINYNAYAQPTFEPNQPQYDNFGIFSNGYLNTAHRIHDDLGQQERRRRIQHERRNTIHNESRPQLPSPDFFNVRNNDPWAQNSNFAQNVPYLGTQPPNQSYLGQAYTSSVVYGTNTFGNNVALPREPWGQNNVAMPQPTPQIPLSPQPSGSYQQAQAYVPQPVPEFGQTWRDRFRPPTPLPPAQPRPREQWEFNGNDFGPVMGRGRPNRRQTTAD